MTLEHFIDVCHARHANTIAHEGRLCRPDYVSAGPRSGEEAGRGACPPPAKSQLRISACSPRR